MQKDKFQAHWVAAQDALQKSGKATAAATRQSEALRAYAELFACQVLLYYPDASYGPLP